MKKLFVAAVAALVLPLIASCSAPAAPAAGSSAPGGTVNCTYPTGRQAAKAVNPPPATGVANTGTASAVLSLNGKPVTLTLDRAAAPCTVNSFLSLASQGYFDGISCHRMGVQQGFQFLQCGDPTGTGSGGPGYQFADELTGAETYPAGTVAMANAGPDTNGSQFFLVFGDTGLQPDYTVFGTVDADGLGVIRAIGDGGTDDSQGTGLGKPNQAAVISSVTVK